MGVELMSWKTEMENMLTKIDRESARSLRVMKLIFKQFGLSLPPDFKQYFLQASFNRLKLTYKQFEIDALLEESMNINLDSAVNVARGLSNDEQSELKSEVYNGQSPSFSIDISDDKDFSIDLLDSEPIEIDEPISHQANTNESHFAEKMGESNDPTVMDENENDSTDAADDEPLPLNIVLNSSLESTSTRLSEGKIKTKPLNPKKSTKNRTTTTNGAHKEWVDIATKKEKSPPNQLVRNTPKKCTVCDYVGLHMGNLNRHMRTHTGEKPYRCDRCGRSFTSAEILMKHAATHIIEFPFHCRVCFHGFPLKAEVVAHEKCCQKRRYECHICKKLVTCVKHDIIKHMRTHTGDKPFRCEICMKRFGRKAYLKQHLNIHA